MSTFIIVATSEDGFIANDTHVNSFGWTSKADKDAFRNLTKPEGEHIKAAVIMGSKTYETLDPRWKPLPERLNIVYSRSKKYEGKDLETTDASPDHVVRNLILRGFSKIAVVGGAEIYKLFLDSNEIDTIYMTIEPIKFGDGIPFADGEWKKKFRLDNSYAIDTENGKTWFRVYKRKATH